MMICPQCNGYSATIDINESLNAPNSTTFTAATQVHENVCNYCLGTGIFKGAGS